MVTDETLELFKSYIGDKANDRCIYLKDAGKVVSKLWGHKVEITTWLDSKVEEISFVFTTEIKGVGKVVYYATYVPSIDTMSYHFPSMEEVDSNKVTAKLMESAYSVLKPIFETEAEVIKIIQESLPKLQTKKELYEISKKVSYIYHRVQSILKFYGPIKDEKDRKAFLAYLWKTSRDEWPTNLHFFVQTKKQNKDSIDASIDTIVETVKLVNEYESKTSKSKS